MSLFKVDSNTSNGLINVVEKDIYPLLNEYYYDEYVTHIICSIRDAKIFKTVKRRIVISKSISKDIQVPVSMFFSPSLKGDTLNDVKDNVNLIKMTITQNDEEPQDVSSEYKLKWIEDESASDQYRFSCFLEGRDIVLKENSMIVEIEIETIVDVSDYVYIQRVDRPCRDFTIHFHYNNQECEIDGNAFGFMIRSHGNKVVISNLERCYVVRFTDWILPGDGACFYIKSK